MAAEIIKENVVKLDKEREEEEEKEGKLGFKSGPKGGLSPRAVHPCSQQTWCGLLTPVSKELAFLGGRNEEGAKSNAKGAELCPPARRATCFGEVGGSQPSFPGPQWEQ